MNRLMIRAFAALLLLPTLALAQAQPPDHQEQPRSAHSSLPSPAPSPAPHLSPSADQAILPTAVPDAGAEPAGELLNERQLSLMEARILSRQGELPKSLALYQRLRIEYPDDQEVFEDYLETLAASAQYEGALFELVRFRKQFGNTPRSERIEAGLYAELARPQYGLDILERALRGNPADVGLWSDIGVQRQASRDTGGAVQAFSEVLENDPENQAAKEALHELLLLNRPRLDVGFSLYDQGRKSVTTTSSLAWFQPVGESTRLFTEYDQVHVSKPGDEHDIKQDLGVAGARVEHDLTRDLTLEAGLQAYKGLGDGLAPMAGARYDFGGLGRARMSYAYHLPWYDQAEAADMEGSQDRLRLDYELPLRDVWVAYASYERENYRLSDRDLGSRWEGTASLSRRLWRNPDVYLTYTFQRAEFQYDDKDWTPIDMLRRELSHAGSLTITKQLASWLEASVSGGIRRDTERHVESLTLSPRLVYHPIERLRLTLGWDYASEATTVAGGESNTFSARFAWTW